MSPLPGYWSCCADGGHSLQIWRRIPSPSHEVSSQVVVTRDWLDCFHAIDGPSWPHDGPFGEEISAKGIPGLVRLPYLWAVCISMHKIIFSTLRKGFFSSSSWCPRIAVHSSHQQCTASRYITPKNISAFKGFVANFMLFRPKQGRKNFICHLCFSGCLIFARDFPTVSFWLDSSIKKRCLKVCWHFSKYNNIVVTHFVLCR